MPPNISEAMSMFNMRPQLNDFASSIGPVNKMGTFPQDVMNREHARSLKKGRSTIERNESTGRDTVFMTKGGPALISEMHKTNPTSLQAVSHHIQNNNNRMRF